MARNMSQGAPESSGLGAVSGTTSDAAPAIRTYLASASGSVTLSGDYFLDSVVEIPSAVTQLELTSGTKLKVRGDHSALTRTGTIVYREQIATAMAKGKTAITVVKAASYKANEYLLLAGDDAIAGGTERYGYLRRVTTISGSTVQLDKALPRTIQVKPRTASVTLSPAVKLIGAGEIFHTDPASSNSPLVRFFAVDTPQVTGITVHDNGAAGIYVAHCRNGVIDCTIRDLLDNEAADQFGYGVNVTGSTRGLVVRGTISRVRHAVTTNVGPFISVLGAAGEPEDCRFEPIAIDCSDKSVDTHRIGWNTTIVPHITGGRGGVQVRADNTHIIGGTITGCAGPGISINPLVAIAPTVDGTIISYLKPSGTALLADAPVIATNLDIRDSYGTNIILASGSTVTGGSINAGGAIGVQFRGSNNTVTGIKLGSNITTPYTEDSGATNNVFTASTESAAPFAAPTATTKPSVSGDFRVGEQLSVNDGTWSIGPLTYYFTWMRNGVALSNATNRTYRTYDLVSGDLNAVMTVRVVAKRAGYQDGTADTEGTVPIGAGQALVPTTQPVLSGTPKAGQTLTVTRGTWDAAAQSTKTAWYTNGIANGTTGTTYLVKKGDLGKTVTVTVTASRTGFENGTFTPPGKTITA
ncbi:hypothetical protein B7R21_06235 [Subtercola boreus]|uniref:Uncharacterized protein n=2 Tax=Subtercola boreus TaxID=120213 RepID=A0A3E0VXU1_9MICO|nr:hypothetical protein B7R21_06235 [Subtercola boreus]